MARVLVATQPWGVLWEKDPTSRILSIPLSGHAASISTTVYAASTGPSTVAFVTNANGELPGWVEEGTYTLTVNSVAKTVEAVSGAVPGRAAALEAGTTWTGASAGNVLTYGTPPVWAPPSGGGPHYFYVAAASGSAATDTANLVAARDAAVAAGGGIVMLKRAPLSAPYHLNANINIPNNVDLRGAGRYATYILLTAATACVTFPGTSSGGQSGDFSIHGGTAATRTAPVAMKVGICNQRSFKNITLMYGAAGPDSGNELLLLEGTQNCLFDSVVCYYSHGNGIGITNSAGTNQFLNCGVSNVRGAFVSVRQTALDTAIGSKQPLENTFYGGVYERLSDNGVEGTAIVHQTAGQNTRFIASVFTVGASGQGFILEQQSTYSVNQSTMELIAPTITGTANATIFDMRGGTRLSLTGRFIPAGALNLFKMTDTDVVNFDCDYSAAAITNFAVKASGTQPWQALIKRWRRGGTMDDHVMPAVSDTAVRVIDAAATNGVYLRPNGIAFGAAGNATLAWSKLNELITGGGLRMGAIAAADASTSCLFRDSADNKLKWKDAAGVVNLLY